MATTKALTTEKLTPTVGAEVLGVDVERLRDDEDLPDAVMEALEEHGVLVFRGLGIDDETQVAFCRKLGELVLFPGNAVPEILVVAVDPEKSPHSELLKANVGWHLDGTVDEQILPKLSMLSAKVLSTEGGDTEFASTYAAYDGLTEQEKERFATLRVHYCLEPGQRMVHQNPTPEQLAQWRGRGRAPLVLEQKTGRRSLVLGHNADYVVGMDVAAGRAFIADLLGRATVPERVYRHVWSDGDTVVWDNRGILHRATPYAWASRRELHRSQIFGDAY